MRCWSALVLAAGFGLARVAGAPAIQAPDFRPALPLPEARGGHIIFVRYVAMPVPATAVSPATAVFLPRLFVMNADGSEQKVFLGAQQGYVSVKEPRWTPKYDRLLFVSDYLPGFSACQEDIFVAHPDGSVQRITGNELRTEAPLGYGAVAGIITDNMHVRGQDAPYSAQQIQIAAQGAGGLIYHPEGTSTWNYPFQIPRVAAGKSWVKVWVTKHIGAVVMADVKPGQVTNLGAVKVSTGNYIANKPSLTGDGQWVVGIGGIASAHMRAQSEPIGGDEVPFQKAAGLEQSVAGSVCVWRAADGELVGAFEPMRAQGEEAKDPAVSPAAPVIAAVWGRLGQEHLALLSVQDLLARQPRPRVLVQGGLQLFQDALGIPTPVNFGAGSPAWSPDGRRIAFCRTTTKGQYVAGQLFLVNADGTGLRQLSNAGPNQICTQPCFSPDGRQIVVTVVTARAGLIDMLYFVDPGKHLTFNLFTMNVDGSGVRQLTNDGVSADPAWGP